jgi:hypothetical protein
MSLEKKLVTPVLVQQLQALYGTTFGLVRDRTWRMVAPPYVKAVSAIGGPVRYFPYGHVADFYDGGVVEHRFGRLEGRDQHQRRDGRCLPETFVPGRVLPVDRYTIRSATVQ